MVFICFTIALTTSATRVKLPEAKPKNRPSITKNSEISRMMLLRNGSTRLPASSV
jgi:hypothetical protein